MTYPLLEWREIVLSRFPAFDPQWDTPTQLAWFDAFMWLIDYAWQAPTGARP